MKRALIAAVGIAALTLAAQPAAAADIPVKAPAPAMVAAPVFNWSGWYAGVHVGYGWGDKRWTEAGGPDFVEFDTDGWLAGGQIGFNIQNGPWVWGAEADISWTNLDGSISNSICADFCGSEVDWLATLTGRVGYAAGPGLFYVKGGGAWADETHTVITGPRVTAGDTRSGWTVGAGYEYDFGNNWSAKLEYNYLDFGEDRVQFLGGGTVDIDQQIHIVKWGLNYRFATGKAPIGKTPAPAPVVTKY